MAETKETKTSNPVKPTKLDELIEGGSKYIRLKKRKVQEEFESNEKIKKLKEQLKEEEAKAAEKAKELNVELEKAVAERSRSLPKLINKMNKHLDELKAGDKLLVKNGSCQAWVPKEIKTIVSGLNEKAEKEWVCTLADKGDANIFKGYALGKSIGYIPISLTNGDTKLMSKVIHVLYGDVDPVLIS